MSQKQKRGQSYVQVQSKETGETLTYQSPAKFFAENKSIAGFENPGKSLYTTIRELVENSLDACESKKILPELEVTIKEFSAKQFAKKVGLKSNIRRDETMYRDYETATQKKRRIEKESKAAAQSGDDEIGSQQTPSKKGRGGGSVTYFKIKVKDNGIGMDAKRVPDLMGRVLVGTKVGVKQARGKFGLGSKMALIWSKISTGLPIKVRTATETLRSKQKYSFCKLDIDLDENEPHILEQRNVDNLLDWRGTEVTVYVEGNWTTYRSYVLKYLRSMAVITPYADLKFKYMAEDPDKSFDIHFERRSDQIPPPPKEMKRHPSSVNLMIVKQLLSDALANSKSRAWTLEEFLHLEFSSISKEYAKKLISELGSGFDPDMGIEEINDVHVRRIVDLFKHARFPPPKGDSLSPVGEYNLRLGILKQYQPEFVSTHKSRTHVYEGHPFIVEAGVSIGGDTSVIKEGLNVYRFANRIPLLFDAGGDVAAKVAKEQVKWGAYKIKKTDRVGVFVSIVSSRIPFKGTGKETVGDVEEIAKVVKATIQNACAQLKSKIIKRSAQKEQSERKKQLLQYITHVSRSLNNVLHQIDARDAPASDNTLKNVKKETIMTKLKSKQITENSLAGELRSYIEKLEVESALEYNTEVGLKYGQKEPIFFVPIDNNSEFTGDIVHPMLGRLRLFKNVLT